jgi:hypothetical protein
MSKTRDQLGCDRQNRSQEAATQAAEGEGDRMNATKFRKRIEKLQDKKSRIDRMIARLNRSIQIVEEIKQMRLDGVPTKEICKRAKVSDDTVWRVVRDHGLPKRRKPS